MNYVYTAVRWCMRVSVIQLFLTLISLPILVGWGLPISYLTPVGTLLFTPVLTVYLWCALAVFFTTLLCIPNGFCIRALAQVSDWWLWTLSLIKKPLVIGFVCPPLPLLCLVPITSCAVVIYCCKKNLSIMLSGLTFLLVMWIIILNFFASTCTHTTVMHTNKKKIELFVCQDTITAVDAESSCSSMIDGASWVMYTVMPHITQKTGATSISRFIVLHPRQRTFEALTKLCKKGIIKDVYVPYWQGHIPWKAFVAYKQLRETLAEYGYRIYILKKDEPLIVGDSRIVRVTDKDQKYGDATYPVFSIEGVASAK